eukprot:EG_transcript_19262
MQEEDRAAGPAEPSSESEEPPTPRRARRSWFDQQLKELDQELEAVAQGRHPEFQRRAGILEVVKQQRLKAAERCLEQRLKNIQNLHEADKKQILNQHDADIQYLRSTIAEGIHEARRKLEQEMHKSPTELPDSKFPTRRTRRRRVAAVLPNVLGGLCKSPGGAEDALSPATSADHPPLDGPGRKKAVAPAGLRKALSINLTLKPEEIQHDLRLIQQAAKRPLPLPSADDDRPAKAAKT